MSALTRGCVLPADEDTEVASYFLLLYFVDILLLSVSLCSADIFKLCCLRGAGDSFCIVISTGKHREEDESGEIKRGKCRKPTQGLVNEYRL